ncbi:hypothetical protein IEQ34_020261 [Dendrobium chrysotoxum]|uniref:TRAM domain-containing protein n=1 Tax=Dendrobium chrysotoxum TaxID=161865 RepID=A0AAV7G1X1_DENCH|nr:hypothetical protein IEQ34_020261 [Dendrobium chrysotoxum]
MAVVAFPGCAAASRLTAHPWMRAIRCSSFSSPSPCPPLPPHSSVEPSTSLPSPESSSTSSFFPKRGKTLELVCESLAFKGTGVCKVADTGFVVLCDRALPGERFIGRVSRKKGNYAEVTKLKTITPHWDLVEAPCAYASYCGGCKTQNLHYKAQLKAKELQVRDLIIHVGRFSSTDCAKDCIFKPIVPCDMHFHYRNKVCAVPPFHNCLIGCHSSYVTDLIFVAVKMEFSFGAQCWVPSDGPRGDQDLIENGYALGLHVPGFFDKVLHIDKCMLQSEATNKVLAIVQDCWRDPSLGLSPYDVHTHRGFLKHLMLRTGRDKRTGFAEVMVNFVTSSYKPEMLDPLVGRISTIPEVVSVMNNVNSSVGNTSVGEQEYTLYGKSTINEMLYPSVSFLLMIFFLWIRLERELMVNLNFGGYEMSVGVALMEDNIKKSHLRWFGHIKRRPSDDPVRKVVVLDLAYVKKGRGRPKKTWLENIINNLSLLDLNENLILNRTQWRKMIHAEVLYKLIEDFANLKGDLSEIVLDLFCGTGTIGLTLARRVRHVYGFEVVKQAVSDARQNAVLNGIHNATFIQGDLNKIDGDFGKEFPKPDIVISDPNRPGMHLKLIKYLLNLQASRIIYISCNPATCARDLDYLCHGLPEKNLRGCYRLKCVQPVDMFPHTPHIECICCEATISWCKCPGLQFSQRIQYVLKNYYKEVAGALLMHPLIFISCKN